MGPDGRLGTRPHQTVDMGVGERFETNPAINQNDRIQGGNGIHRSTLSSSATGPQACAAPTARLRSTKCRLWLNLPKPNPMCGRYTLITPEKILAERFVLDRTLSWSPRYNLGPTQEGLVVRRESTAPERTATRLRWGLIPHWTHRDSQPSILINARSETAANKPAFRDPFRHRRCLVLADGFIERGIVFLSNEVVP